jgi:general stress protein 26
MATTTETQGDRQELDRLLRGYHTAVLTTRGPDGHFHARPIAMQQQRVDPEELWFVTSAESQKVQEIQHDPHCAVALHGTERDPTYVSLSGTVELVRDRAKIHALWEPGWKPWFPDGPDSPHLVLIRFRPEHAEYVHPQTGRLTVLFSMVRALVTRTHLEPAPKKEVDLRH